MIGNGYADRGARSVDADGAEVLDEHGRMVGQHGVFHFLVGPRSVFVNCGQGEAAGPLAGGGPVDRDFHHILGKLFGSHSRIPGQSTAELHRMPVGVARGVDSGIAAVSLGHQGLVTVGGDGGGVVGTCADSHYLGNRRFVARKVARGDCVVVTGVEVETPEHKALEAVAGVLRVLDRGPEAFSAREVASCEAGAAVVHVIVVRGGVVGVRGHVHSEKEVVRPGLHFDVRQRFGRLGAD